MHVKVDSSTHTYAAEYDLSYLTPRIPVNQMGTSISEIVSGVGPFLFCFVFFFGFNGQPSIYGGSTCPAMAGSKIRR